MDIWEGVSAWRRRGVFIYVICGGVGVNIRGLYHFWLFEREKMIVEDEIGQVNVTGRLRGLWITISEKVVLWKEM